MKIAIHPTLESFSQRWINYLDKNKIEYITVNAFDNDILKKLAGFDLFLWHWHLHDPLSMLNSGPIMKSIENMGVKVFPNDPTSWHYDDKVAQKYLLESIGAPLIPSFVFYIKEDALKWASATEYPTVFKLKRGAGSYNVKLIKNRIEAEAVICKMFSKGMSPSPHYFTETKSKLRKIKSMDDLFAKLKRMPSSLKKIITEKELVHKEKDYVLFQKFMPQNEGDTRIVVIGEKAFGLKRKNRPGDFRASGSGTLSYNHEEIDEQFITEAFSISKQLKFQSMAYDFLYDQAGKAALCEISFCFDHGEVYRKCEGHWTPDLNFIAGHEYLEDVILETLISEIKTKGTNS